MTLSDEDAIFFERARSGEVHAFGHREHLRLAFLATRVSDGSPAAVAELCEGAIRRIAMHAGEPEKFHATITKAWATMVVHHVNESPQRTFDQLIADEPVLSDSHALLRHFSRDRLFGPKAQTEWVEPDLAPLPGIR